MELDFLSFSRIPKLTVDLSLFRISIRHRELRINSQLRRPMPAVFPILCSLNSPTTSSLGALDQMDAESAEIEPIAQIPQIDKHNVPFFHEDHWDILQDSFGLTPFSDIAFRVSEFPDDVVIAQSNPTYQSLDFLDSSGVADTEYLVPSGSAIGFESASHIQHDTDGASLLPCDTFGLPQQLFNDPHFLKEYSHGNAVPTTFPSFCYRNYELSSAQYRYGQAEYSGSSRKEWEVDPVSLTSESENTNIFSLFEAASPRFQSEGQQIKSLSSGYLTETMPNLNISTLENSGNDSMFSAQRLHMESNMMVFLCE